MDPSPTLASPSADPACTDGRAYRAPQEGRWLTSAGGREVLTYAAAALVCVLVLTWLLRLWETRLHVPLCYQGDAVLVQMLVKTLVENPWYLSNGRLGAPGSVDVHDFPLPDNLHFGILKLLSLVMPDPFLLCNVYFLLTFPLTALSSLFVLRHFGVARPTALLVGVLYAFTPYHLTRSIPHLFLGAYYALPLLVMVILWIALGRDLFVRHVPGRPRKALRPLNRRALAAVAICLVVASGAIYYSFFACYLLLGIGLSTSLRQKRFQPLAEAGVLIGVLGLGVLANLMPNLIYQARHGPNPAAVRRSYTEAELYGLKVTHLVLPPDYHRIERLAKFKQNYDKNCCTAGNEAAISSPLGMLGSAGFFVLLAWQLTRRGGRPHQRLLTALSALNLLALVLAMTGGLSVLFAMLVSAHIRAYCRISILIGFFALFCMALLLDRLKARWGASRFGRWAYLGLVAVLLALGLLDQTCPAASPDYFRSMHARLRREADYVRRVEAAVPAGSLVYQLPYMDFPEHPAIGEMQDYDHFRVYLHSRSLHWSYGSIKGRAGDRWQQVVAALYPEDMLRVLSYAGFRGIHVDRFGYADRAAALGSRLHELLGVTPLESRDGRYAYYDMARYNDGLRACCSEPEYRDRHDSALHLVCPDWQAGFSGLEIGATDAWRWCAHSGQLWLRNPSSRPRQVTLELTVNTAHAQPARLVLSGSLYSAEFAVSNRPTKIHQILQVPPGNHLIKFDCDAPLASQTDGRKPVFRVSDFLLRQVD